MNNPISSPDQSSIMAALVSEKKNKLGYITTAITVVVFLADQISKKVAFASDQMSDWMIIPNLFGFLHHKNYGIIANIPIPLWAIFIATCLILVFVERARFISIKKNDIWQSIGLSFIFTGAVGNLFDRLVFGFVRDWIWILNWSVINIADISITIGVCLLLFATYSKSEDKQPSV